MSTGVLYVMSTVVSGLIKIGKTTTDRFDSRMYELEHNGYRNVTGLRRRFAIEVENYDEKERMLDDIFAKARVPGSELFVLDINLAIELPASFEGHQIYPKMSTESKSRSRREKPSGKYRHPMHPRRHCARRRALQLAVAGRRVRHRLLMQRLGTVENAGRSGD